MRLSAVHWVTALLTASALLFGGLWLALRWHQNERKPAASQVVVIRLTAPPAVAPAPPPPAVPSPSQPPTSVPAPAPEPEPEPQPVEPPAPLPPEPVPAPPPKPAEPVTTAVPVPSIPPPPAVAAQPAPPPKRKARRQPPPKPAPKPTPKPKPKPKPAPKPVTKPNNKPAPKSAPAVAPTPPSVPADAVSTPASEPAGLPALNESAPVTSVTLPDSQRDAYKTLLVSQLNLSKRYPRRAQLRRIEGTVTVQFSINGSGQVLSRKVSNSSGAAILDEAALSMIDRASPLPKPPAGYGPGPHTFSIPIGFTLR